MSSAALASADNIESLVAAMATITSTLPESVYESLASAAGITGTILVSSGSIPSALITAAAGISGNSSTSSTSNGTSPAVPSGYEVKSHGIHSYNAASLLFFAIVGLILQVPVMYTHCGLEDRPNIPVLAMSSFYAYIMLSTIIAACHWHSGDSRGWWDGAGWCDIDVRVALAVSLGVEATQCVINWNIMEMLKDRPRLVTHFSAWRRSAIELALCVSLPVINLAISTFFMSTRYAITQDIGCTASVDSSVATIMVELMWVPLLGLVCLLTLLVVGYRFYNRGRVQALEQIAFLPSMNTAQFIRIIVFAVVIAVVLVPLSICVAVVDFISIAQSGVHDISWAHGKPAGWDQIARITLQELSLEPSSLVHTTTIINFITHYVNIGIAWLLFICYGTGDLAIANYKSLFFRIFRVKGDRPTALKDISDSVYTDSELSPTFSRGGTPLASDSKYYPGEALKGWEHQRVTMKSSSSSHSNADSRTPSDEYPIPHTETAAVPTATLQKPRLKLGDFLSSDGSAAGKYSA